jgi:uncharacterized membrane protein YhhN
MGILLAAAVAALVLADYWGSRVGVWLAKPLASSLFVAIALANGALGSSYGGLVLTALALSWLGDVLLIPDDDRVFRAGVGAFGLAHAAYLAAFALRGIDPMHATMAAVGIVPAGAAAARWLRPHVPPDMKLPVDVYMAVISAMVVAAYGAFPKDPWILVGAVLFYASDLLVARQRFVAPSPWNPAVGLPLYYTAQFVLASTV